jgi:hypothetical protein
MLQVDPRKRPKCAGILELVGKSEYKVLNPMNQQSLYFSNGSQPLRNTLQTSMNNQPMGNTLRAQNSMHSFNSSG